MRVASCAVARCTHTLYAQEARLHSRLGVCEQVWHTVRLETCGGLWWPGRTSTNRRCAHARTQSSILTGLLL
jgi:hypothetical protein